VKPLHSSHELPPQVAEGRYVLADIPWRDGALAGHRLVGDANQENPRSTVLPGLDDALLAQLITPNENQTLRAKAYRAALESR
jgi:hypothetical protein